MPNVECLLTLNGRVLMLEGGQQLDHLLPLRAEVRPGESPIAACTRAVQDRTGYHVSPSCAGVIYGTQDAEHDYTLVFIAEAPGQAATLSSSALHWVDPLRLDAEASVAPLQREMLPLLLQADGPLVIFLEGSGDSTSLRESAPIPHARLSPLVFAVAP